MENLFKIESRPWNYRIDIIVDNSKVSGSGIIPNFPIYIDLSLMPDSFFRNVKADGSDIRISQGKFSRSEVPFELVSINTINKTGELWASVDLNCDDPTHIQLWYGNLNAQSYPADSEFGSDNVDRTSAGDTTAEILPPLTVKSGVVRVIDSATGDIARTTGGFIEDEKYGVYALQTAAGWSAEFDSDIKYNGKKTLKLSTTDTVGKCRAGLGASLVLGGTTTARDLYRLWPAKPSTLYYFEVYVQTNNVANNAVYVAIGSAFADLSITNILLTTSKLSGTNAMTKLSGTFTTEANTVAVRPIFFNDVAGNVGSANFAWDDIKFTEVSTITNSSSSPALYYPSVTAVTSTDNIDQSQVGANTGGADFGQAAAAFSQVGQQFLPTKKNLSGIVVSRRSAIGTNAGDVTISLQTETAGKPSGTILSTYTYLAATWNAITEATDITVPLSATLTVDGSTKYWIVASCSTADTSNHPRIQARSSNPYTSGIASYYVSGAWSADTTFDLYFKTLYSKNTTNFTVSTDTQTVSVTAPTVDGWADGTIIDTADGTYGITPITIPSGTSSIYVTSNGPETADGEVDPSLQCTLSGQLDTRTYPTKVENQTAPSTFYKIVPADISIARRIKYYK